MCNLFIKEIKFLFCYMNKKLEDKIVCLEILCSNFSSGDNKFMVRLRYRVYVVGSYYEWLSLSGLVSDEFIFMIYDLCFDIWIFGMVVGRIRI